MRGWRWTLMTPASFSRVLQGRAVLPWPQDSLTELKITFDEIGDAARLSPTSALSSP